MAFWKSWSLTYRIAISFVLIAMLPVVFSGAISGVLFNQTSTDVSSTIGQDLVDQEQQALADYVSIQSDLIESEFEKYEKILEDMVAVTESLLVGDYIHSKWDPQDLVRFDNGAAGLASDTGIGDIFIANFTILDSSVNKTLDLLSGIGLLFEEVAEDEEVLNTYVGTAKPGQVTRFFPYIGLAGFLDSIGAPNFDVAARPWYTAAIDSLGTDQWFAWTVYQDASRGEGEYTATISAPFYNGTEVFGVVGIDIKASAMSDLVSTISYRDTGYGMLIENDDVLSIVTLPNLTSSSAGYDQFIGARNISSVDTNLASIVDSALEDGSGTFSLDLKTGTSLDTIETKIYAFQKIAYTNWWLIIGLKESEVRAEVDAAAEIFDNASSQFITRTVLFELLILAIAIVAGYYLSIAITRPLKKLQQNVQRIEEGDFDVQIELDPNQPVDTNYEIETLRRSIVSMKESLNAVVGATRSNSEVVAGSVEQLSSSFEELNASAEEVASTSHAMSNGAITQTELINEVSEEIKQTTKLVDEIISNIRSNTNQVSQIALQTNILALNAGIEASRAGDYGRGFAVVAENIRKLSDQSKGASESITEVADEIASRLEEAFNKIATTMLNVVSVSEETAASAEEVASAAEEMTASIMDVTQSSEQLVTQAEFTASLVKQFKITK